MDDAIFAVLDVISNKMRFVHMVAILFCLILPVTIYNDIFLPCWECHDFEAAAVHEIGHILGFDHPDVYPQYNFILDRESYNCSEPWESVSMSTAVDEDSVMVAFLPRNPKTCLTKDDLDGLNFLYPVCTDNIQPEPTCIKVGAAGLLSFFVWHAGSARSHPHFFQAGTNIGFPRLLQAIVSAELIPLMVVLVIKIVAWILLATRDELIERQIRSEQMKTLQKGKVNTQKLEARKARKREATFTRRASHKGAGAPPTRVQPEQSLEELVKDEIPRPKSSAALRMSNDGSQPLSGP